MNSEEPLRTGSPQLRISPLSKPCWKQVCRLRAYSAASSAYRRYSIRSLRVATWSITGNAATSKTWCGSWRTTRTNTTILTRLHSSLYISVRPASTSQESPKCCPYTGATSFSVGSAALAGSLSPKWLSLCALSSMPASLADSTTPSKSGGPISKTTYWLAGWSSEALLSFSPNRSSPWNHRWRTSTPC